MFYPAAEFLVTTRITRVDGEPFKTEGKVMVAPGWLAVYGKEAQADEGNAARRSSRARRSRPRRSRSSPNQTRPPARFTEATLLSAMEGAGKLIDDEELREAMREKGLGTPATRAQIIEGLITEKYVLREGRELQPDRQGVLADRRCCAASACPSSSRPSSPANGNSSSRRWSTAS